MKNTIIGYLMPFVLFFIFSTTLCSAAYGGMVNLQQYELHQVEGHAEIPSPAPQQSNADDNDDERENNLDDHLIFPLHGNILPHNLFILNLACWEDLPDFPVNILLPPPRG